jgi:glutathione S-transferase
MQYLDVEQAIDRPGLRLVLSAGVPGPWGEAAKYILHVKRIPYAAVRQVGGGENDALERWTGHANAPVAVYEKERPRAGWIEILQLAERLAPEPRLVPDDARQRAWMFGLAHELAGEQGFGWCRRLAMIDQMIAFGDALPAQARAIAERLGARYGWSAAAAAAAPARVAAILRLFSEQLRAQRERGSRYLVGDRLSALDLYWTAFAALVEPLPQEQCPMAAPMRAAYTLRDPAARSAADPGLLEHRDFVYREHLALPLDF